MTGSTETPIIPSVTREKWDFTHSLLPSRYPAKVKIKIHITLPTMQKNKNRLYAILPKPATKGANVLTIGMNRARITVLPPCFS